MRKETIFSILIISLLLLSTNILNSEEGQKLDEYSNINQAGNNNSNTNDNWVNSTTPGMSFPTIPIVLSGNIIQTDPNTGDKFVNSDTTYLESEGVEVEVSAVNHTGRYYLHLQLWGIHADSSSNDMRTIRHGSEIQHSSQVLRLDTARTFQEILFFYYDSSDDTLHKRDEGCYWFEVRLEFASNPNAQQYLVIESDKIDFSPAGQNHCLTSQSSQVPFPDDDDGDGIINDWDDCPNTVGSYVNNEGCAYEDSDYDGVPDYIDQCILPQPVTNSFVNPNGCAYEDRDNDGVPDHVDSCESADENQFVDNTGCVDLDTDNDGILNSRDQCGDTNSTDYVDRDGCKIDNYSVTLVDNKCDSSKMFDCTSPLVLIGGGLVGGVTTNATINRLRKPKKPETSKFDDSNNEGSNQEQDKEPTDGNTEEDRESNKEDDENRRSKEEDDENRKSKKKDDEKSECSIPIFILEDAICGEEYSYDLTSLVDGYESTDKFVAENIGSGNWASVSSSGIISGLPEIKDFGLTKILVRVTNSKGLWADVEIRINVRKKSSEGNNPPKWIKN